MTTVLDWIDHSEPEHLEEFIRMRAQRIPDPYNPNATVEDWRTPDELELSGSWSSSGSSASADPVREQLGTRKQIAIFDAFADVLEGDRIRDPNGSVFTVTGRPERDRNPWSGYQPTLVLPVEEWRG